MGWGDVKRQCRPIHNRDDVEYATGCMKKRRYDSVGDAKKACKAMSEREHKPFNWYPCRFCGGDVIHIGSHNEIELNT